MISPFAHGKFEHSARHLYFFDTERAVELESSRPVFLIGSRGSGKTTLLKALDIKERRSNQSLLFHLGKNPYRGNFIGCYSKLSLHPCRALESLYAADTALEGRLFGLYIESLFVSLISRTIADLVGDGALRHFQSSDSEGSIAITFANQWPDIFNWAGVHVPETFNELASAATRIMHCLQQVADRSAKPEDLTSCFRVPAFNEFSREVLRSLAAFCDSCSFFDSQGTFIDTKASGTSIHFKVCLDEVEALRDQHILVLNTLMRNCEAPLFPVLSFVSAPADLTSTLIPNISLQKADAVKVVLEKTSAKDFLKLAEGVATIRCRTALQNDSVDFCCARTLGELSLDSLVGRMVESSEAPEARELHKLATAFEAANVYSNKSDAHAPLPYIEAFIHNRDRLGIPPQDDRKAIRKQRSEAFRKKMVVAYIAICALLKKKTVPFAYDRMVLGSSDQCIRDFLSQLHQILIHLDSSISENSLRQFLAETVPLNIQEAGIRIASEAKRDSLPASSVLLPDITGRIVKAFAIATHLLQTQMIESGVFILQGGTAQDQQKARKIVRDASDAGFLRMTHDGSPPDPIKGFRVHTSLAAAYGFSYRGAYYDHAVQIKDFFDIAECSDDKRLRSVAERISRTHSASATAQKTLFTKSQDNAPQ